MEIIRAPVLGFCSGVRSAVHYVEEAIVEGQRRGVPVYTIGSLIHNDQYLKRLAQRGVTVIERPEDAEPGVAVIRAHGISASLRQAFAEAGFIIIDGTCSRVLRSQSMVRSYSQRGWDIVLVGDPNHGEVTAVAGSFEGAGKMSVVTTPEDAERLAYSGSVLLLSQTTFTQQAYSSISDIISRNVQRHGYHVKVMKTICPATKQRQAAVKEICQAVEAMLVIGGASSSNTRRLLELSIDCGVPSWRINTPAQIPEEVFHYQKIGITAGASTPDWLIEDIEQDLLSYHTNSI